MISPQLLAECEDLKAKAISGTEETAKKGEGSKGK